MCALRRSLLVASFSLALLAVPDWLAGQEVSILFRVKVPASTAEDAKVYIVGDARALGAWQNQGAAELKRDEQGVYVAKVSLAKDQPIEFKLTRGSWETVEKHADGSERPNRTLTPTRDATVDVTVAAWADQVRSPATAPRSTRTGDVRVHSGFHSKLLNNRRDLFVYLPPGYEKESERRYPVFYMHDGQNLFDRATSFAGEWNADETAERLIAQKKIQPIIIVGIAHTAERVAEYTPFTDPKHGGGNGCLYADFLVREVKPFIDATYRTRPGREETAVGGSSLGGLISLHIARRYPQQFSKVAAISPALWWGERAILTTPRADWLAGKKLWIDMGTAEGNLGGFDSGVEDATALGAAMKRQGLVEGEDYVVRIVEGAKHDESAWSQRFAEVLQFLFPP